MFNFFIFDLDDTLIATGPLDRFRGTQNINKETAGYEAELLQAVSNEAIKVSITEDFLLALKASHQHAKFSVVTISPRFYAKTLLNHFYPNFTWDAVVGFEDVASPKPDPDGLYKAFIAAGCDQNWERPSIILIGDGQKDVIAAYRAGIRVILYAACWSELTVSFSQDSSQIQSVGTLGHVLGMFMSGSLQRTSVPAYQRRQDRRRHSEYNPLRGYQREQDALDHLGRREKQNGLFL